MIALLFEWATSHLLLVIIGGVLSLFGIGAGVRAVRKARKRRSANYVKTIERSRSAKANTVRGRMKAKRQEQPLGVFVRKRASDDPRLVRKVVRKIKTARTNKQARTMDDKPKELLRTKIVSAAASATRTKTEAKVADGPLLCKARINLGNGRECMNSSTIEDGVHTGHCHIPDHIAQVRRMR